MLLLFFNADAQNAAYQKTKTTEHFDAYIQNAMALWKTPGLSVVVVKNNNVIFKKAYGVKDIKTKDAFATSTLSVCASTTKAMTAVCMGMLVDAGKIKWTDKVSDVYPELKLYDNYASNEITIKTCSRIIPGSAMLICFGCLITALIPSFIKCGIYNLLIHSALPLLTRILCTW
jgi:CubicO group peptidase (beta-lactamase class C family)